MISADTPSLGERIDALTRFLPALEGPDVAGSWVGGGEREDGAYVMPRFAPSNVAEKLTQACNENGWVTPFGYVWRQAIAGMIEVGHIAAILRRLTAIRGSLK